MSWLAKNHGVDSPDGFTLAEVVLALGIVLFCVLPIVGMLPVGMNSIRDARNEIAATSVVGGISKAILNAGITGTGGPIIQYAAPSPYKDLTWSIGSPSAISRDYTNLSYAGVPTNDLSNQHLNAHVQMRPPATLALSGTALVSVAWPKAARWDSDNQRWVNAQGSIATWVVFIPRQ